MATLSPLKRIGNPLRMSHGAAQSTLAGIELMPMLRKGQMEGDEVEDLSVAEQFYALAS